MMMMNRPHHHRVFFSGFDDALETFSLDALVVVLSVENNNNRHRQTKNATRRTPDLVSKPKAIVYDDWYARAKEALTTNDFSSDLSTKKGNNTKYAFTLEEKKKKKKRTTTFSPFELVWRFSTTTTIIIIIATTTTGRPSKRKKETTMERC